MVLNALFVLHVALHFAVLAAVARLVWPATWRRAWLIMSATILVDLDHLLVASTILDPARCSIGFYPLHSIPAILIYALALGWKRTRLVGAGLLIHMAVDLIDCFRAQVIS